MPLETTSLHNGTHAVAAGVTYTVRKYSPDASEGWVPDIRTLAINNSFDVGNLVIIDQSATKELAAIKHRPDADAGGYVTVKLAEAAADVAELTFEIYKSDDNVNPVARYTVSPMSCPGNVSWHWDGMGSIGGMAPTMMASGVYPYRVVGRSHCGNDDLRSPVLKVLSTDLNYDVKNDVYLATCTVNAASDNGRVAVFYPDLSEGPVSDATRLDAVYSAAFPDIRIPEEGEETVLMRVWDSGDLDGFDRAHRSREALPLNQKRQGWPAAIFTVPHGGNGTGGNGGKVWRALTGIKGYFNVPNGKKARFTKVKALPGEPDLPDDNIDNDDAAHALALVERARFWVFMAHVETGAYWRGNCLPFGHDTYLGGISPANGGSDSLTLPNAKKAVYLDSLLPKYAAAGARPTDCVILLGCYTGVDSNGNESALVQTLKRLHIPVIVATNRITSLDEMKKFLMDMIEDLADQAAKDYPWIDYMRAATHAASAWTATGGSSVVQGDSNPFIVTQP